MQDFDDSTLWRISEFERVRLETGSSGYARLGGPTVLPTTLVSELSRLEYSASGTDPMEVIAACMRHREPALIYVLHRELVWPITVFPRERLYHSPRDLATEIRQGVRELSVHSVEPPILADINAVRVELLCSMTTSSRPTPSGLPVICSAIRS